MTEYSEISKVISRLRLPTGINPYTKEPVFDDLHMKAADLLERLDNELDELKYGVPWEEKA